MQHLMARPCHKRIGYEGGRHGATPRHFQYTEKKHGWPRPTPAERKPRAYSNLLGARRRQKKEGETEEDMAKHFQRRPGRDVC